MLEELKNADKKIISIMRSINGVLGGWYFGSILHEMSDEYSDIDIVFLIDGKLFEDLKREINRIIAPAADKIILCWAEDFNNEKIANYDYLLMSNGQIFQYDIFLLNNEYINDFMCKLHYRNLKDKNIIFDLNGDVKNLIDHSDTGSPWSEDINRIIDTYWLHVQMSVKYFLRKDFFKLNNVLRILMDTHTSLILTGFDRTNWGSSASKLHFTDIKKQMHLMRYGCTEDFESVRRNLLQSILWFEEDIAEIGSQQNQQHSREIGEPIKKYWINKTEKAFLP